MNRVKDFSAKLTIGLAVVVVVLSSAALAALELSATTSVRQVQEARTSLDDMFGRGGARPGIVGHATRALAA